MSDPVLDAISDEQLPIGDGTRVLVLGGASGIGRHVVAALCALDVPEIVIVDDFDPRNPNLDLQDVGLESKLAALIDFHRFQWRLGRFHPSAKATHCIDVADFGRPEGDLTDHIENHLEFPRQVLAWCLKTGTHYARLESIGIRTPRTVAEWAGACLRREFEALKVRKNPIRSNAVLIDVDCVFGYDEQATPDRLFRVFMGENVKEPVRLSYFGRDIRVYTHLDDVLKAILACVCLQNGRKQAENAVGSYFCGSTRPVSEGLMVGQMFSLARYAGRKDLESPRWKGYDHQDECLNYPISAFKEGVLPLKNAEKALETADFPPSRLVDLYPSLELDTYHEHGWRSPEHVASMMSCSPSSTHRRFKPEGCDAQAEGE